MPFSVEEFFAVFAAYNTAIWPLQIVAYLGGVASVAMLWRPSKMTDIGIFLVLSAMWAINGIGYHWISFAPINPAASVFAALFVLQAVLLAGAPLLSRERVVFGHAESSIRWIAGALIVYAMALYPILGFAFGHRYPAIPVFGVAPCPTTIFTIGVLLLGDWKTVRWLLIVPAIWSVIGGSAAFLLSVPQDFGLIAAGLMALGIAVRARRSRSSRRASLASRSRNRP